MTEVDAMSRIERLHIKALPEGVSIDKNAGMGLCFSGVELLMNNSARFLSLERPSRAILLDGTFKLVYGGWCVLVFGTYTLR